MTLAGATFSTSARNLTPANTPLQSEKESVRLPGYTDPDSVMARLRALPLSTIEGLWEFPADGGLVAIERNDIADGSYRIVVVMAANRSILPGTVMGTLRPTAKPDTYEARLFTAVKHKTSTLHKPKSMILTLAGGGDNLIFKPIKKGISINLWRLIPYMWRIRISYHDDTPTDLGGLIRVWPEPRKPLQPYYL